MVFLCKCCTGTHTRTRLCVCTHTNKHNKIVCCLLPPCRSKLQIQIRARDRDRAVLLLTRQNKYGDRVASQKKREKQKEIYVKKRNGNKMAQGDSMALAETLRRPHILRYLSLSLPTNFTARAVWEATSAEE